jgi:hypothetical protein
MESPRFWAVLGKGAVFGESHVMGICVGLIYICYILERGMGVC